VAAPVIDAAERIYVGAADGTFYAFDPLAGREIWRVPMGAPVAAAAALGVDGVVHVAAGTRVSALSADGATRWTFDVRPGRGGGRVTLGVRETWQSGLAIGPGGDACAGNDDFFFYCLDPGGGVAWAKRTGLPVWALAAFGDDGTAYVPSLDMNLYALEPDTGAERWRRDLGCPLAAAAAVGDDGTMYVSAMDGQVHAVDGGTGTVRWSVPVSGPVVSSPAVAADGTVYVTSTDGRLSALDGALGARRWTRWFGGPLRSSPAIGPDPEGIAGYLVYVGAGDGWLYALGPDGQPRWAYDAGATSDGVSLPYLDGGPALGRYGVAVGSTGGAVHYVPYDYYLREGATGIRRTLPAAVPQGPRWRVVRPAGTIDDHPLGAVETEAEAIPVGRTQVVTLRAAQADSLPGLDPVLSPEGATVLGPRGMYRTVRLGDRRSLALVPEGILPGAAAVPLSLSAPFTVPGGPDGTLEGRAVLQAEADSVENPIALRLQRGFRIANVTVSQPPAAAALVGPAMGAIAVPFAVVDSVPARRTFTAWGMQAAGPADAATAAPRTLLYALRGRWNGDAVVLDAASVFVDVAGVTIPLDRIRLAGRFVPGGRLAPGASLVAEVRPPGLWAVLDALTVNGADAGPPRTWWEDVRHRGSLVELLRAAIGTVPAFARLVARRVWEPLGLVNPDGDIVAIGTFDLTTLALSELAAPPVRVRSIVPDPLAGRVVAEVVADGPSAPAPIVAILLVDTLTGEPVPLDYNRQLVRERLADGALRVELQIPSAASLPPGRTRAHVMANLASVAAVTF